MLPRCKNKQNNSYYSHDLSTIYFFLVRKDETSWHITKKTEVCLVNCKESRNFAPELVIHRRSAGVERESGEA